MSQSAASADGLAGSLEIQQNVRLSATPADVGAARSQRSGSRKTYHRHAEKRPDVLTPPDATRTTP